MEALSGLIRVRFTLVGAVPEWFFRGSLDGSFTIHPVQADIGLIQASALEVDLPATVRRLHDMYPLRRDRVEELAAIFGDCHLVVSDIAPMGISAARMAGIPSVLLENFTWDWIYEGYQAAYPEMKGFVSAAREAYGQADYHIQAAPVCIRKNCDLHAAPVARMVRGSRESVRRKLGVGGDQRLVLVSMGGEGMDQLPAGNLDGCRDTVFLVPGKQGPVAGQENIRFLAEDFGFFHPDLVAASDVVIGKVGYSTLAEIYQAGVPFGYIPRPGFRESGPLVRFIRQNMSGVEIDAEKYKDGRWLAILPQLFAMEHTGEKRINGADQCAGLIASLLTGSGNGPGTGDGGSSG
jgi:hypothetical protein